MSKFHFFSTNLLHSEDKIPVGENNDFILSFYTNYRVRKLYTTNGECPSEFSFHSLIQKDMQVQFHTNNISFNLDNIYLKLFFNRYITRCYSGVLVSLIDNVI